MNYRELLAAMFAARRFGVKLGLEPMRHALAALGHPERRVGAVVHIGGTNGKGSTAAFVDAMLRAAGVRTGLYTSPHLCRFTERFRVDGAEVDGDVLAARYAAHRELLEPLTFFERATLLALDAFAAAGVQACVLEVGLGGRLDATNAVDGDVCVVTGVALDHMDMLGAELDSIAAEKAGIFKRGRAAVVGAGGEPAARARLLELAEAAGASEVVAAADAPPPSFAIGLRGVHQAPNAACALAAIAALERTTSIRVPAEARWRGLADARWPGRLEELSGRPRVWLDAAHNPNGASALQRAVLAERPGRLVVVAGVSGDKDVAALLAPLVSIADVVVCTQGPSERALPAAAVAAAATRLPGPPARQIFVEPELPAALERARKSAGRAGDLVVVFGSIFLVGGARALLTGEPVDPVVTQEPAATLR